jgi:hypothetical protein
MDITDVLESRSLQKCYRKKCYRDTNCFFPQICVKRNINCPPGYFGSPKSNKWSGSRCCCKKNNPNGSCKRMSGTDCKKTGDMGNFCGNGGICLRWKKYGYKKKCCCIVRNTIFGPSCD